MKAIFRERKYLFYLIHAFCWMIFFLFPILLFQRENEHIDWIRLWHHLVVPLSFCLVFYVNYLGLIPELLFRNRYTSFIIANLLLLSFVVAALQINAGLTAFPPPLKPGHPAPPRILFMVRDFISLTFTVGLSIAIRFSIRWKEAEDARQEAERSRVEAELKNLRNQLNPHFLLNTLNNIYALTMFDTDKAQQAIQDLSRLLRYVLYENQQATVALHKELDFIRDYIELMRIRLSEHVEVRTTFEVSQTSRHTIAPLIFISLIENAFKHGISPTEKSFIHIHITEEDDHLTCLIVNSYHPKNETDKSGSGIGLEQVRKRLDILYPEKYDWEQSLNEENNLFISNLTIYFDK